MLPPFFIVGAPRSGTTLLATILDSHSRIGVYRESHYYQIFRPNLHRYGDLGRPDNLRRLVVDVTQVISTHSSMKAPKPEEFLEALVAPTFEGVFATMLKLHARQHGKLRSGEKSPGHHAYLDDILEKFPESPVIFVMRDPRDCILSMRKALGMSLRGAASEWNAAFISYQKASRQVQLVCYEEFVRNPAERAAELLAFLGETYEPEVLHYFERIRKEPQRAPPQHRKLLEPVDPTNIGRFRQMPRSEIEWIESACAEGMEGLGYEFAFGKPTARPMLRQSRASYYFDRLRFYGLSRSRWQRAFTHWKHVLRLRARSFRLYH